MVNESVTFGLSTLGVIGGLVILLWGVSLNSGQALNAPVVAGGVVVLLAFGLLTTGVARLDGEH